MYIICIEKIYILVKYRRDNNKSTTQSIARIKMHMVRNDTKTSFFQKNMKFQYA